MCVELHPPNHKQHHSRSLLDNFRTGHDSDFGCGARLGRDHHHPAVGEGLTATSPTQSCDF